MAIAVMKPKRSGGVARGCITCVWTSKSATPQTSRRRRRNDANIAAESASKQQPPPPPTLVVIPREDNDGKIHHFLCRWQKCGASLNDAENLLLAYEDSVDLVEDFGTTFSNKDMIDIFQDDIIRSLWPLVNNDPDSIPPLCSCCTSKSKASSPHQHTTLQTKLPAGETTTIAPLYAIPLYPEAVIPLQTLRISVQEDAASSHSVLLQSYRKRQLVGQVLAFDETEELTSQVRLACPTIDNQDKNDNLPSKNNPGPEHVFGVVESVTAMPVQSHSSHTTYEVSTGFYLVLPSTRITITTKKPVSKRELSTLEAASSAPSAAARTLLDTIKDIMEEKPGPRTFLLSGSPGTGKTFSIRWAWQEAQNRFGNKISLCSLRGSELLQTTNPAKKLQQDFEKLAMLDVDVALIFLDECDALVSNEPISAMLAALLDSVDSKWRRVMVVGATNRIDAIPSFLRRAGRFDREVPMTPPSVTERAILLKSLLCQAKKDAKIGRKNNEEILTDDKHSISDEDIHRLAEVCVGYVPADLSALVRQAWLLLLQDAEATAITVSHLEAARQRIGASALRDTAFSAPSQTTWADIAGDPGGAKTALRQAIEWPRLKAREFQVLGLQPPRGILLHGPPGCAKTTLARAAAGASGVAFLSLSPAQVYASSYVGEAEAVVRRAFALARSAAPCILFFDEIDSIFGNGENGGGVEGRGSSAEARVLSTFLNEMDGVDISALKDGVLVLGATNRPWTLDAALLRPGRLGDKIIFLPPPNSEARLAILQMQFAALLETMEDNLWDWDALVHLSKDMTGAEVIGACQEAKMLWMRKELLAADGSTDEGVKSATVLLECVHKALESVKPILSNPQQLEEFRVFQSHSKGSL